MISYRRYVFEPTTVNTIVIVAANAIPCREEELGAIVAVGTPDAESSAVSLDDNGVGAIGSTPSGAAVTSGAAVGVPSVASLSSSLSSSSSSSSPLEP